MLCKNKLIAFYFATALSALGDSFLYFGLPFALSVKTGSLGASVALYIVPAISMLASIKLASWLKKRIAFAKNDYAKILILLGLIEVGFSVLLLASSSLFFQVLITYLFILVYAFLKEGIPRLFYVYSVYSYFCETKDYQKVAGRHQGIVITASLIGVAISGFLSQGNTWKYALLFDAISFATLGITLLRFGTDPHNQNVDVEHKRLKSLKSLRITKLLKYIYLSSGATVFISSLFWPYLPFISKLLKIDNTGITFFLLAVLRAPGLVSSLYLDKITQLANTKKILFSLPLILYTSIAIFFILPSIYTMALMIFSFGTMSGIYYPLELSYRKNILGDNLIDFNAATLRFFSISQLAGTLSAFFIVLDGNHIGLLIRICTFASLLFLVSGCIFVYTRGKRDTFY